MIQPNVWRLHHAASLNMQPEISILVSSYERPRHLERVLVSIACQKGVLGRIEVVVTDDGSQDDTLDVVNHFAERCSFPIRYTTHAHRGFQLARCRNDGVRASSAAYLLFLDGDCVIPTDHVEQHLKRRRRGVAWSGFCYRLGKVESAGLDMSAVMRGDYLSMPSRSEIAKLRKLALKSRLYSWIRHPTKPRLFGGNIGVWRSDYERVNGYDENFVGWGGEDDDLRMRLRRSGVRIHSILPWTRTYHLWHPPVDSAPASIMDGDNIPYLHRPKRLTRCLNGLVRREATDLRVRLSGDASRISSTLHGPLSISDLKLVDDRAEVELALASATFLDKTAWKILVLPPGVSPNAQSLKIADMIVTDDPSSHGIEPERAHGLGELETALRRVA